VGIGATSPTYKLLVYDGTSATTRIQSGTNTLDFNVYSSDQTYISSNKTLYISGSNLGVVFRVGSGSNLWQINSSGHFIAGTDNTYDIGASGATRPRTGYFGTSLSVGAIDASAALTVTSTTKGFLPPRLTTTQRDAISSPATGLQVYNTTTNTNDFYNGTAWTTSLSGTYTPTAQDFTNITSATVYTAQYMRVGNVVTVSGKIEPVTTTAATLSYFTLSLPTTLPNFNAEEQAAGSGMIKNNVTNDLNAVIYAGVGSAYVQFQFIPITLGGARTIFYQFTYLIR
jgi:hypothetical protein